MDSRIWSAATPPVQGELEVACVRLAAWAIAQRRAALQGALDVRQHVLIAGLVVGIHLEEAHRRVVQAVVPAQGAADAQRVGDPHLRVEVERGNQVGIAAVEAHERLVVAEHQRLQVLRRGLQVGLAQAERGGEVEDGIAHGKLGLEELVELWISLKAASITCSPLTS